MLECDLRLRRRVGAQLSVPRVVWTIYGVVPPPSRGQRKRAGRVHEVDKRAQSPIHTFLLPPRIFIRGSGYDSRGSEVFRSSCN